MVEKEKKKPNKKRNQGKNKGKQSVKRFELSPKEMKINLEQLQKDVKKAYDSMMKVVPESVKDVDIKSFGNASHIILPKEFSGKRATVIIKK